MLFPTVTFAVFFLVVYSAHLALRTRPVAWKAAMLVASYVFYGWWDWRFCGLIALSTIANWLFGLAVDGSSVGRGRAVVGVAVITNLAGLGVFKYYGFFVEALSTSLGSTGPLPLLELALPIGISFFTFQALSYVVDIQRKKLQSRSPLDFAVYLSFFPQLVAGPIVRATEFLPQLDAMGATPTGATPARPPIEVNEAAWLICRGLFKKMVIATYLADAVVDPVFAAPSLASRPELLLAFYGYAIQIYADFSGYTDIAIGIALLLGFRFPVNFDNPYRGAVDPGLLAPLAHDLVSLAARLPLHPPGRQSDRGRLATYRNLMATMSSADCGTARPGPSWSGVRSTAWPSVSNAWPRAGGQAGSRHQSCAGSSRSTSSAWLGFRSAPSRSPWPSTSSAGSSPHRSPGP